MASFSAADSMISRVRRDFPAGAARAAASRSVQALRPALLSIRRACD